MNKIAEKPFYEVIEEAFSKINQFKKGNLLFYQRFHKSRAVVSSWKSGKVTPSVHDMLLFVSVSNEVIKECRSAEEDLEAKRIELMKEFQSLVSTGE